MKLDWFMREVKNFLEEWKLSFTDFLLSVFRALNSKAHVPINLQKIRNETAEHVHYLSWTLEYVVLPFVICYLCLGFLLGQNVLDSLFLGVLIFVYSNFLPDILSAFRIKNKKEKSRYLTWYKKYALLCLAPMFVFLLFGSGTTTFKTVEQFHNIRSLAAYSIFLSLIGLIFYGDIPLSWGRILEVLSPTIFGAIGYVTHLRVDKIL